MPRFPFRLGSACFAALLLVFSAACGDSAASRDEGPEARRPMPPPPATDERCLPGELAACYGGPELGVPVEDCHLGERECSEDGFWGTCRGWRRADSVECPPTDSSPTAGQQSTEVPPTEVPPTEPPSTEAPPTEVPPTDRPPTEVPPTEPPPTEPPPTEPPPTVPPPTEPPPTEPPPTDPPPTGPVDPGTYAYTAIPVASFGNSSTVDWSPDGTWAVIGRRSGAVHVVEGDSLEVSRLDLPGGGTQHIERVRFDPDGRAWVVGWRTGASDTGFIHILERDPEDEEAFVWHTPEPPADASFQTVLWDTHDGLGLLLGATRSSPYQFRLWSVDPETLDFAIVRAGVSGAGCQDVARVDNEFGDVGYLIVCGVNGSSAHYWTRVAGAFELRSGQALGTTNLGNISRVEHHPDGAYALVIGWSGRRVHRFEAGRFVTEPSAPWFSTRGIWNVRFAPDGRRALITGRRTVSPPGGLVMEYRHDLWRCPSPSTDCDLTEVLIPGFDAPPWNAGNNADLSEAAWRPGCDGGLIVGGESGFSFDTGILARFDLVGGRACWDD